MPKGKPAQLTGAQRALLAQFNKNARMFADRVERIREPMLSGPRKPKLSARATARRSTPS